MTLTFNRETYASLLVKYQPKIIKTDEENEQAITLAEELSHRVNRTLEESALLDLLIALIEKYEDEHYPMGESTANSMFLHLIDAQNVKEAELVAILGSTEVVSQVMSGKQEITQEMAKVLGNFFHVDSSLFEN
ncbi:transcription regulator [Nostoc commune NIES-4072]|uniref:Transcription regulator n=1 Tax=Nostoc commune NIES-4072 TaxID=2005467 RepID=A0A2R5FUY9_NOSCO|nr:transcriptional regulator [Nostoc commune]BBD67169.1 transcription regulator [Nostoc commune HK-02]GBG21849.1 transcription regulator [Nostoc commune NIES-4072]